MSWLIEIYPPFAAVNLHDAAKNFLSFNNPVIAGMRISLGEEPRGAVFLDKAVDEESAVSMNQDNIPAADVRRTPAPNDGYIAGAHPRQHARSAHSQRNSSLLGQRAGNHARVIVAAFAGNFAGFHKWRCFELNFVCQVFPYSAN
jgi:hypothetical protein